MEVINLFDRLTLKNGLRVIGEKIDHFRSVSVGLWLNAGSQYEIVPEAGISHFLEHMVFKGTEKRTARQIAEEMDAVGGQLNAFTSKECTCFYAKVVDEHLPLSMDVLSDLATAPKFDPQELEKEKGVVIEEIAMAEDSPEDVVHELIMLSHFGDQPVARPILGTEETVSGFTREGMLTYWKNMYAPASAVLALAGNYDWNRVCELAENHLGRWDARQRSLADFRTNLVSPSRLFREKDIEQANVCLGFPGVAIGADETYEFSLINSVLGGSMSSRLFQKIREEKGMAYSIYSYPNTYTDCGMLSVYAATRPDCLKTVVDMAREEIQSLAEKGMAREEFEMAREQLKASYILGLESTASRMNAAGRRLLLLNRTRTEDEVIAQINAITFEGVNALAKRILSAPGSVALVGKDAEKLMESI
jgi:predicted Zn-dependent peptidase